jgi:hypothetical protein
MKQITSPIFLLLAGGALAAVLVVLATSRPESHRPTPAPQPPTAAVSQAPAGEPTLAPPREVVYIQVQADKSGLEVGWADN